LKISFNQKLKEFVDLFKKHKSDDG